MKRHSTPAKRRRPPGSQPLTVPTAATAATQPAAGGPQTRGDSRLGTVLANLLAYFEQRTVTSKEIELIGPTHENGWLRPEIEAKLGRLHPSCPDHRELHRLVTLSVDLLTAVDAGRFNPGPGWGEIEPRLLRALAYFVRAGDAIPDHLPNGYDDDMREFQAFAEKAGNLLTVFDVLHRGRVGNEPAARPPGPLSP